MNCPVCRSELVEEPRRTRKRGKPYILIRCPRNPKHFKGFIHEMNPEATLSHSPSALSMDAVAVKAELQTILDALTPEEKERLIKRLKG